MCFFIVKKHSFAATTGQERDPKGGGKEKGSTPVLLTELKAPAVQGNVGKEAIGCTRLDIAHLHLHAAKGSSDVCHREHTFLTAIL